MSGFEDGFPYGSENEAPRPKSSPFDVEIERILIDLRSWDIERPDAVKAIKQLVDTHVIGGDAFESGYSLEPIERMKQQEARAVNRKLSEQRQSLWGEQS